MFGDYASNLMFLPNPTRRELLHFVAGGGLTFQGGSPPSARLFVLALGGKKFFVFVDLGESSCKRYIHIYLIYPYIYMQVYIYIC